MILYYLMLFSSKYDYFPMSLMKNIIVHGIKKKIKVTESFVTQKYNLTSQLQEALRKLDLSLDAVRTPSWRVPDCWSC